MTGRICTGTLAVVVAVLLLAASAAGASAAGASAAGASAVGATWSAQGVPNPPGPPNGQLSAVTCVTSNYCIAVGEGSSTAGGLAELWNGATWTILSTPAVPGVSTVDLQAVSCASQSFCMAVGGAITERWDGAAWHLQSLAAPGGGQPVLTGVSCTASTCVAVGYTAGGTGASALAERFNGQRWSVLKITRPTGVTLSSVSCSSATACTAVGDGPGSPVARPAVAERFNGVIWTPQTVPNLASPALNVNLLQAVSCPTQLSCVAVGTALGGNGDEPGSQAFIERWNGATWSLQSGPSGLSQPQLYGVSCSSATSCEAFGGTGFTGAQGPVAPLALRYDGQSWSAASTPDPTHGQGAVTPGGISCLATGTCLAVGTSDYEPSQPSSHLGFSISLSGLVATLLNTPSPLSSGAGAGFFNGVSCTSPSACTAVGLGATGAAVERFDGHAWSVQLTPDSAGVELSSVSCISAVDCTAVGYANLSRIERWSAGTWTIVPNPNPAGYSNVLLASVSCTSASNCLATGIATGGPGGGTESLAERWDGHHWAITPTSGPRGANHYPLLSSVSCTSASACIAVGGDQSQNRTLTERWNGHVWRRLRGARTSGQLTSVACVAADDCLAVGPHLAERWNGRRWEVVSHPPGQMQAVSCETADRCTAVGAGAAPPGHASVAAAEFNGVRWTSDRPASPGSEPRLNAVDCATATGCEAVGQFNTIAGSFPLAELSSHPLRALARALPASAIRRTRGTLRATVSPRGSAVTGCQFEWGTTGESTNSTRCSRLPRSATGRTAVSVTLRGLIAGTTYYYRVRVNTAGGAATGPRRSFTTPGRRGLFTFGNASVSPRSSSFRANLQRANPYSLLRAGRLQRLAIYLQPTGRRGTQTLRLLLYRDAHGLPGQLVAESRRLNFRGSDRARWYSAAVVRRRELGRGHYWIGVITGGQAGVAGWRYADVGVRDTRGRRFATGASSPFRAAGQDRAVMSMYAVISAGRHPRAARATGLFRTRTVCKGRCVGRSVVPG